VPGDISAWIIASSDRYIIAYFLGTTSVGIYSAAYALGTIPLIFAAVLGIVLAPTLSKLYDEGRMSEVKIYLSYSLKYFLALAIPFVFGAAILGKPVLGLFSTVEIASQGYFVVPMVALGVLLYGAFAVIYHTLVLVKKTRILGVIWIIAALVNLGLNIMVVPYLGIMGAALACLIAYSLVLGMGSYYSFRELTFDIDWRFIIKSLIASAIMALVIWIISNLNVIITVLVGVAVYGVGLFLLKGFKREEIAFFSRLFSKNVPAASSDNKTE
jgi:O-antigen/teichoic acid export membrane protein